MSANTLVSMTGFARSAGISGAVSWSWEVRSVNGKGLDIKLRLPGGLEGLEIPLRESAAKILRRGNVNGTLTLKREATSSITVDQAALAHVLTLALDLAKTVPDAPVPRVETLLTLPGIMRTATAAPDEVPAELTAAVSAGFADALAGLAASRAAEGEKLAVFADRFLAEIAALHAVASDQAADQPALHKARLQAQLAELLTQSLPEERIAQEIALLATKSDVREELDRLAAHIAAARALLAEGANVGRKLDFLMQEFNREANTLCSKSASLPLTATGLALKAAIEQLREQVQNIE
jgi:uncharacterized protein (TIGR00255 family)